MLSMKRMVFYGLVLVGCVGLGCKHRVSVNSVPAGAALYLNDEPVGATPQEITVDWRVRESFVLTAHAQGYRPLSIDLVHDLSVGQIIRDALMLRWKMLRGHRTRMEHELLFIREHGAAGTWSAEDARRN